VTERSSDINWFDEGAKRAPVDRVTPNPNAIPIKSDNRRKHTRFQVASTQVILQRDGLLSVLSFGGNKARKVCDLSQGGARVLVTEKLEINQKVRLKITLEKYQDEIEIGGHVKWCFPSTNKKDFFVGIKFNADNPVTARKMSALQEWFTSPQYQALKSRR
jgi:Tfp pilus assembly protein PilZ